MTPARTKAEEVLRVLNDVAEDLMVEAGEAAVEEFWDEVLGAADEIANACRRKLAPASIPKEVANWPNLEIGDDPFLIPLFATTDGTAYQRDREIQQALRQLPERQPTHEQIVAQILANRANSSSPTEDRGRADTPPAAEASSSDNPPA